MKLHKLLTIALTVLAALAFSSMTTFAQVRVDNLTPDELNTVSQNYFRAAQEGNLGHVSEVMAPEFRFIDEQGTPLARAACAVNMAEALSGIDTNQTFQTERIRVNNFVVKDAQTMAVGDMVIETMLYADNVTVQPKGKKEVVTFDRYLRWTNVWVKSEDTYKVILTQLSPTDKEGGIRTRASGEETAANAPACTTPTASLGLLPIAVASLILPSSLIAIRRRRRIRR